MTPGSVLDSYPPHDRRAKYLPGVDSPENDPGPPPCPGCGDECAPESLPTLRELRWPCCGHREPIDPMEDLSL